MPDIIDQLIEIDNRAHEILGDVEEEKRSVSNLNSLLTKQIKDKIKILTELELEKFEKIFSEQTKERSGQIRAAAEYFVADMKKEFASNRNKWCKEIFDGIINDF